MSKAFTRESDDTTEARPRKRELELPVGALNYMTAAGARRLRAELDRLLTGAETASPERIQELTDHLASAEIVDPSAIDHDQVRFGSTVTLTGDDGPVSYRIVGIAEAEPRQGWVSWLSPIARSLLGARVGDLITVRSPKGAEELEVARIAYDDDTGDDA